MAEMLSLDEYRRVRDAFRQENLREEISRVEARMIELQVEYRRLQIKITRMVEQDDGSIGMKHHIAAQRERLSDMRGEAFGLEREKLRLIKMMAESRDPV